MEISVILLLSFAAAFLGTVLMTVSQEIEIRLSKRPISHTPAIAVFSILRLNFEALSSRAKVISSYVVHFAYGTVWGFPLAFLYIFGVIDFWIALIVYYIVVLLQGWIVLPLLGISGPPWTWGARAILTEAFHKAVYSIATVAVFVTLL